MDEQHYKKTVRGVATIVLLLGILDLAGNAILYLQGKLHFSLMFVILLIFSFVLFSARPTAVRVLRVVTGLVIALLILLPVLVLTQGNGLDLVLLQLRIDPLARMQETGQWLLSTAAWIWIFTKISRAEVESFLVEVGKSRPGPVSGFVAGVTISVVLLVVTTLTFSNEDSEKALTVARSKVDPGQKLSISSLKMTNGHVVAEVIAFDENSMQTVTVEWDK